MREQTDAGTPAPRGADILDVLEEALTEQIDAARQADMDRVESLAARCEELLAAARQAVEGEAATAPARQAAAPSAEAPRGETPPPSPGRAPIDITRLWHLAALHDRIRLTLAAHRAEAGRQLGKLKSGRKIVRAYGAGST